MALLTRSDVEPIDPSEVPIWVSDLTMAQYFLVAILAVLVYDTVITMDKEIKYFWGTRRNSINIAFIVNRYIGILGAAVYLFVNTYKATLPLCNFSIWTSNLAGCINITLIDYILMIRVLALYSQNKTLSLCLKVMLVTEAAFVFGGMIYVTIFEDVVVGELAEDVMICAEKNAMPLAWGIVDWSLPMVYAVIVMALALYKAVEFWRMSTGFEGFALVKIIIQDQVVYFVFVILCCVFNIVDFNIIVSNSFAACLLGALGSPSFLSVLGSRMLINLKEAGEQGLNEGTSYRMMSMSVMEFS